MSEHQKIFTFSFELEHILYVKNSEIVKSKDVLFDNITNTYMIYFIWSDHGKKKKKKKKVIDKHVGLGRCIRKTNSLIGRLDG